MKQAKKIKEQIIKLSEILSDKKLKKKVRNVDVIINNENLLY